MKKHFSTALFCSLALLMSCNNESTIPSLPEEYTGTLDFTTTPVVVTWTEGGEPVVEIPSILAKGVKATVDGGNVVVSNTYTSREVMVKLRGTSSSGSLTYVGNYKCSFTLDGVDLTSQTGAALDIQCGKRVGLILADGTDNRLEDAAIGEQKAALYCKGHMEVEGSGNLTVAGNARHAIATKEYLQLKKTTGSITIARAASDALHIGQYFQMGGGTVAIDENTVADGIQVDPITLDDDITPDPEEENNGQIIIKGGNISVTIAHEDSKAVKSSSDITISGGTFLLKPKANGSRGIQTDGNLTINEETASTSITIPTEGGKCTQPACAADPHRCMGIKVGGNMKVEAGTITVSHTHSSARDIKVTGDYVKGEKATVIGVVTD